MFAGILANRRLPGIAKVNIPSKMSLVFADPISKYEHFSHISSQEYFTQLLTLYTVEWLRQPLLQGLATSAVAGTEGLVRASRAALIEFFNAREPFERQLILLTFLQILCTIMSDNLQNDRYAIPTIEFLAFLIDSYATSTDELDPVFRKVFVLVQKAHFRSSNLARLEAAARVYAALAGLVPLRADALKKMSVLLLHPFPRVCLLHLMSLVLVD